jgi:hypothetical protein
MVRQQRTRTVTLTIRPVGITPIRLATRAPALARAVAACALFTFGAVSFAADNYPSRSIRVIVPFAAGGAMDARQ